MAQDITVQDITVITFEEYASMCVSHYDDDLDITQLMGTIKVEQPTNMEELSCIM